MATVNKDFKIKSGLIVEGTTGTINGYDILTKKPADDQYIIDLIGGETLVKSVSNEFDVSQGGELSLDRTVVDAYYDEAGAADAAETAANSYTDGRETAITTAYQNYADQAELDAVSTANAYTDTAEGREQTNRNNAIANAISDLNLPNTYDAKGAAATAEQNAKDYADDLINDASSSSSEVWSAYKTGTEIGLAQAAAELHADNAVAALVDGAPALLDTLNELAAALQDNPDVIQNIQDVAAGKQDTLTAGNGIVIDDNLIYVPTSIGSGISVTPSTVEIDRAVVDTWYDESGAASDAQAAAETFATNAINALSTSDIEEGTNLYFTNQRAIDAVGGTIGDAINELNTDDIEEGSTNLYFTDSRAKTSAADLLTGANLTNITITGTGSGLTITAENGVADSTTDDLSEGEDNLYFTDQRAIDALQNTTPTFSAVDINSVAKQVAGTTSVPVAGIATAYSWAKADYRSAEFLVKVAYGTHTEISKVLVTLDTSDNISVTEYGIVGTNGSGSSSVSAAVSGNDVQLNVTTLNNTSTVTVVGTLLA
jgi:hypothetical protein